VGSRKSPAPAFLRTEFGTPHLPFEEGYRARSVESIGCGADTDRCDRTASHEVRRLQQPYGLAGTPAHGDPAGPVREGLSSRFSDTGVC
jgi:hypothetical protein